MRRNVDLNEISDGKLYTSNDMVKADCYDCQGCSACCRGMGKSIILDPIDLFHLKQATGKDFAGLLNQEIELNVVDGMILPNLKMDPKTDACPFLDENERCGIHAFRSGICRLFPLGRLYEEEGFRYFLLTKECKKENRGKVKVKKWLGIPNLKSYEKYISDWHQFLLTCEEAMIELEKENIQILTTYILRLFYQTPYEAADDQAFYQEFYERRGKTTDFKNIFWIRFISSGTGGDHRSDFGGKRCACHYADRSRKISLLSGAGADAFGNHHCNLTVNFSDDGSGKSIERSRDSCRVYQ